MVCRTTTTYLAHGIALFGGRVDLGRAVRVEYRDGDGVIELLESGIVLQHVVVYR